MSTSRSVTAWFSRWQLAWSRDHGATWTWADWKFTTSFSCPTFLNFGRNYAGACDEFVYVYSLDNESAYEGGRGECILIQGPAQLRSGHYDPGSIRQKTGRCCGEVWITLRSYPRLCVAQWSR